MHMRSWGVAVSFIVKMGKHEYWVNVDERAYESIPERTYFVAVIYRDGNLWYEEQEYWAPAIDLASRQAMGVIVEDWERSR